VVEFLIPGSVSSSRERRSKKERREVVALFLREREKYFGVRSLILRVVLKFQRDV